jgi:hypothetical protein
MRVKSMKRKIIATTTVFAALIGMAQVAQAQSEEHQFTPIEELSPEIRQEIGSRVYELTKGLEIDWDQVALGLNEKGEIIIRAKTDLKLKAAGTFSCGVSVPTDVEKEIK